MFKTIVKGLIVSVFFLGTSGTLLAKEHGYIMSIPNEIPTEQLYKVNIQRVNGKNPMPANEYWVAAGEATVRVSLVLNPEFAPKLTIAADEIYTQEIKITVEDGSTYQLAGKVDQNASSDAQRDGSFWETIVHKVQKKK